LEQIKEMKDNSIDSCVTDPPYGISFMGKKWDYDVPQVELWEEVMRVLKPGGHALVACGTTGIACKLEGFEFIGIELEPEYVKIAEARIEAWKLDKQEKLL